MVRADRARPGRLLGFPLNRTFENRRMQPAAAPVDLGREGEHERPVLGQPGRIEGGRLVRRADEAPGFGVQLRPGAFRPSRGGASRRNSSGSAAEGHLPVSPTQHRESALCSIHGGRRTRPLGGGLGAGPSSRRRCEEQPTFSRQGLFGEVHRRRPARPDRFQPPPRCFKEQGAHHNAAEHRAAARQPARRRRLRSLWLPARRRAPAFLQPPAARGFDFGLTLF